MVLRSNNRGYTIMEVVIAMAILAMSLVVLLGTQSNSVVYSERANQMAIAALMARSKMIDVEHEILEDGFSDFTEQMGGDFRDEGFPDMRWEAIIDVVEITPDAEAEFGAAVNEELFGSGDEGGSLTGASSVSQFLPMIVAQIPVFINDIGERVRRVTLVIEWDDRGGVQQLTVQSFVVNLSEAEEPLVDPSLAGPPIDRNNAPVLPE